MIEIYLTGLIVAGSLALFAMYMAAGEFVLGDMGLGKKRAARIILGSPFAAALWPATVAFLAGMAVVYIVRGFVYLVKQAFS